MSYSIFIQKFKSGEPDSIDLNEFMAAISEFGQVEQNSFGLEIISSVGDLFETASISEADGNGISGISFHRPAHHEQLRALIFQILQFDGTCFFDQDMDYFQYRNLRTEDLPAGLLENAEDGLIKVSDPSEIWPSED
jgi:hypothetical protein